ncbi:MAG: demethoxyubiquinone hydroxylase family protein [Alphaproteobacteria bacterium]|nr:MAG: demethoxyubiquinone hydroxylase family protein [Alphaproteobacteria bacterium]
MSPKPRKNMGQLRPGAKSSEKRMAEMLRVDHAGEYGATRIYQGQLAVLGKRGTKKASAETIRHMEAQEQVHLETFNKIINERAVRPTALTPIWHVAGFALGATTALMGEKAAMACTAAVEDVIDEHYQNQLDEIDQEEAELKATIARFREEEIEHHDIAIEKGAEQTPGYRILTNAIKAGTRFAIKLSEKV